MHLKSIDELLMIREFPTKLALRLRVPKLALGILGGNIPKNYHSKIPRPTLYTQQLSHFQSLKCALMLSTYVVESKGIKLTLKNNVQLFVKKNIQQWNLGIPESFITYYHIKSVYNFGLWVQYSSGTELRIILQNLHVTVDFPNNL